MNMPSLIATCFNEVKHDLSSNFCFQKFGKGNHSYENHEKDTQTKQINDCSSTETYQS